MGLRSRPHVCDRHERRVRADLPREGLGPLVDTKRAAALRSAGKTLQRRSGLVANIKCAERILMRPQISLETRSAWLQVLPENCNIEDLLHVAGVCRVALTCPNIATTIALKIMLLANFNF